MDTTESALRKQVKDLHSALNRLLAAIQDEPYFPGGEKEKAREAARAAVRKVDVEELISA